MSDGSALLRDGPRVVNVGLPLFAESLRSAGVPVTHVDWRPPAGGRPSLLAALDRLRHDSDGRDPLAEANAAVVRRIVDGRPLLVDVRPAGEVIPDLCGRALLHAGPPLTWEQMTGPMRGAAIGAVIFEGWAADPEEAVRLLDGGGVTFMPCHHLGAVGPMGGITSRHMPGQVVEEAGSGVRAFCTLNEGLGKVLRFGAYSPEVIARLCWMRDVLGPTLGAAVRAGEPIDLRAIMGRALAMGDEFHQRNAAATLLLLRELAPRLATADLSATARREALEFLGRTDQFFLNLAMAAAKAVLDAAARLGRGSVVTTMARNGVEFGIRLSGTGERWFTAPVNTPQGLFFGGYGPADASPDIGDSAITEALGVGAFCMAAAPAVVPYVGAGRFADALAISREMAEITLAANPNLPIPELDGQGAPTGIDVRLVVETGITPLINTGIAHREAGGGQVGAGTVRAPLGCFEQALLALAFG